MHKIRYLSGPFDLAVTEQFWRQRRQSTGIETDVFVFARGEPDHRHVTKIGGLPYRPANEPWPTCSGAPEGTAPDLVEYFQPRGTPMSFLAQFSFVGSSDIVGNLPGDILLIFTEGDTFGTDLHFEWYSSNLTNLIAPNQVPEGRSPFNPSYGYICRLQEPKALSDGRQFASATKIGGNPDFIQPESQLPGKFICQLGCDSVSV
ncbi:DUF1963 domain-containing protein [Planctomycetota bacterium]